MTNPQNAAFSIPASDDVFNETNEPATFGLTKREYFAVMALQGVIASQNANQFGLDNEFIARTAVNAADWLIKALNEKP